MTPNTKEITPQSTMQEVLEAYPSAQRAMFTRYHIGGCSSCGFQPTDTLEQVLKSKNVLDIDEAIAHITASQENDDKMQISPQELAGLLKEGKVKLLDVRSKEEHQIVHMEGDQLLADELVQEIKEKWSKDTAIVLYCHFGQRSLDAASYLIGHGFTQARSLRGGIDAWSKEIDSLTPTY